MDGPQVKQFSLPLTVGEALAYDTAKSPQAEVRDVNQSPVARRFTNGTKWASYQTQKLARFSNAKYIKKTARG